jgi:hypothetical protein
MLREIFNTSKAVVMFSAFAAIAYIACADTSTNQTYFFRSGRSVGQVDRVEVQLEVGGETKYNDSGKLRKEKMSIVCKLDYFEKTIDLGRDEQPWRSAREYRQAAAIVKLGEERIEPKLRPANSLIAVEATEQGAILYSPQGNLTRDELDAIDIQANSLLLDRLLPEKPLAVGESFSPPEQFLAALLGLDRAAKSTVQCTLKEVVEAVARFEMQGRVEGSVAGAAAEIELKGRYRFDRARQRIDWLGMLIKEDRRPGAATDGLDAISRLQMTVVEAPQPDALSDAALAKFSPIPTAAAKLLAYETPGGGCRFNYDRRWVVEHSGNVMRLVDDGVSAGQCNFAVLPRREPDKLVSLEEFQNDVRSALGANFGEFVTAAQSVNAAGLRVLRVTARGAVRDKSGDLPVQWTYYHLADRQGRQAALTFTVEQQRLDIFADADKEIVDSLRFAPGKDEG